MVKSVFNDIWIGVLSSLKKWSFTVD
jgi:hypothetical protein